MARKKLATAESILAGHSPPVRALADELRRVIRRAMPEAVETANPGWHSLNYRHPQAGYVCGLFPREEDVRLAFEFGALLADPDGLLTGEHMSQVRYLHTRRKRDIRVRALTRLLRAAVNLPASREARLGLVRAGARPISDGRKERS